MTTANSVYLSWSYDNKFYDSIKNKKLSDFWDMSDDIAGNRISTTSDLSNRQTCREIGRVVQISKPTKPLRSIEAKVEVTTPDRTEILKFDLIKIELEHSPWPGVNFVILASFIASLFLCRLILS